MDEVGLYGTRPVTSTELDVFTATLRIFTTHILPFATDKSMDEFLRLLRNVTDAESYFAFLRVFKLELRRNDRRNLSGRWFLPPVLQWKFVVRKFKKQMRRVRFLLVFPGIKNRPTLVSALESIREYNEAQEALMHRYNEAQEELMHRTLANFKRVRLDGLENYIKGFGMLDDDINKDNDGNDNDGNDNNGNSGNDGNRHNYSKDTSDTHNEKSGDGKVTTQKTNHIPDDDNVGGNIADMNRATAMVGSTAGGDEIRLVMEDISSDIDSNSADDNDNDKENNAGCRCRPGRVTRVERVLICEDRNSDSDPSSELTDPCLQPSDLLVRSPGPTNQRHPARLPVRHHSM